MSQHRPGRGVGRRSLVFADRRDGGRQLADLLDGLRDAAPIVLALPRGGVPVAAEVAEALGAELDVLVVRKLGVPFQPELAMGAIAPDGVRVMNESIVASLGIGRAAIEVVAAREGQELERRIRRYRAGRPPLDVRGRTVVLVDDGIATGATARAALHWLRRNTPLRIVLAVPVIAADSVAELRGEADELVAVTVPESLDSIGAWYDRFDQVDDEEVISLLKAASRRVEEADDPSSAGRAPEGAIDDLASERDVQIPVGDVRLDGTIALPAAARGVVVFAHGSGSGRFSPRNRHVARVLREAGLGTLLMDLLTRREEQLDERTAHLRFDIRLLADRLEGAIDWLSRAPATRGLAVGLFGASTGGGAALVAAAERGSGVAAVVSRGGRPDLAGEEALGRVEAPTLLIVGGADAEVLELNRGALAALRCEKRLSVVPGATHLFEEPGALDQVSRLAADWFAAHCNQPPAAPRR